MKLTNNFNDNIFREYDIRGLYGAELNEDTAYTIGKSFGSILIHNNKSDVLVAYDNRDSSPILFEALTKGILETGVNVTTIKLSTTPMFYFALNHLKIGPGIMITASHNPKEYNGFKMTLNGKFLICGEEIEKLKKYTKKLNFATGNGSIKEARIDDEYIEYITSSIKLGNNKLKVVIDCGNGTASIIAKKVFESLNIDYIPIFCESDPNFPNHHPDPSDNKNMNTLQQKVIETKSNVGIAFDGDGDRLGIVNEKGEIIEADQFMIIIIRQILKKLDDKRILFDVKCSKTLEDEIIKLGGTPIQSRTGASYLRKRIYEENIIFGGEFSGHIYFNDKFYGYDDGIYAALRLLEILSNTNKTINGLLEGVEKYYSTDELKMATSDEKKFSIIENIKKYAKEKNYNTLEIDGCKIVFEDGFALVRASNTGPNISMRFEAKTEKRLKEIQAEFTTKLNELI